MKYKHTKRKTNSTFKYWLLATLILGSIGALLIYLGLIWIDHDLRQEIKVMEQNSVQY